MYRCWICIHPVSNCEWSRSRFSHSEPSTLLTLASVSSERQNIAILGPMMSLSPSVLRWVWALAVLLGSSAFRQGSHRSSHRRLFGLEMVATGFDDTSRLQRARLRLAEAQGKIPIGASETMGISLSDFALMPSSQSRVREISWRVAEPEVKYDPIGDSSKFFKQPLRWIKRNIEIFVPLTFFVLSVVSDIIGGKEEANRGKRAEEILGIISNQSPALIKAGQALASRPDLLPTEYLESLQKLQDRCPAYPTEKAVALFEKELGTSFDSAFDLDSPDPIATASIGQVYKGRLRSNGARVAIKIQRPNCEEAIAIDLFVLRWYAQLLQRLLKLFRRDINLVSVIDDFGDLIYREIDYRAEAVNAQRFAELYASIPDVFVPKVYTDLSSGKVLTMEWVDGARLSDRESIQRMGLDSSKFVDTLVQCTLRQMLENGFFHADPRKCLKRKSSFPVASILNVTLTIFICLLWL